MQFGLGRWCTLVAEIQEIALALVQINLYSRVSRTRSFNKATGSNK
jgi:hypothetical protein